MGETSGSRPLMTKLGQQDQNWSAILSRLLHVLRCSDLSCLIFKSAHVCQGRLVAQKFEDILQALALESARLKGGPFC